MNNLSPNYKKYTLYLIAAAALLKLLLCGMVELNNDEAYYWTYAKQLQWNYFDHPPMVALCIRFFTGNLHLHHEFFLRLPAVLASAACTWIVFQIGKLLQDEYTGWIAACLLTASFYAGIIAGLLILPDTPQLFFWLLSVYILLDITQKQQPAYRLNIKLLLAGLLIGCCILSKVHGIFLWIGFGGYVLFKRKDLLKNPFLYLSALLTAVLLIPSFLWTVHNQFSTYTYHSSRVSFGHLQPDSFFRELLGEALYNNPINFVLLISSFFYFQKNKSQAAYPAIALLRWLSLPLILTVLAISLFNDTLPHWSGPAYTAMIPLIALYVRNRRTTGATPPVIKYAVALTAGALILTVGLINYWPGSLGKKEMPGYGKQDVTLDMCGWRQFGKDLSKDYPNDCRCIFTNYWFPGGHLDFYVAEALQVPVIVTGSLSDIHNFAWQNARTRPLQKGENACYITISNFYDPPAEELTRYFRTVSAPTLIPQWRSGKIVRYFYVYKLTNYLGGLPTNGITRR